MVAEDIRPELDLVAPLGPVLENPGDVIEVDRAKAPLGHLGGAPTESELPGLVRADIDAPRPEQGQQLGEELVHEGGILGRGGEGTGRAVHAQLLEAVAVLCALGVTGVCEPALHMAEGVLVGHEDDTPGGALVVDPADVVGRERGRIRPDLVVPGVGEGVLQIELELVDPGKVEQLDQPEQGTPSGHPVTADVEHETAHGEVGPVFDLDALTRPGTARSQLVEGALGVTQTLRVTMLQTDARGSRVQTEPLRGKRLVDLDTQRSVGARPASGELPDAAGTGEQGCCERHEGSNHGGGGTCEGNRSP